MSNMTIGGIAEVLNREERTVHTRLQDITVSDGGQSVVVRDSEGGEEEFAFDEVVERHLGQYLDVSPVYLKKCPAGLKATNLNYWLHQQDREDSEAVLTVGPNGIENVYSPDKTMVTVPRIAEMMSRTFRSEDEIVNLVSQPDLFHADILVRNSITVPGNGLGDRPDENGILNLPGSDPLDSAEDVAEREAVTRQVWDITHGGVRILHDPSKGKAPRVERYFNRLICNNGMTMPVVDHGITVRGKTVDEVIESMEEAAQELLSTMDQQLEHYRELANVDVPGNPILFIQQLGREQGLPEALINRAIEYAGGMGFGNGDNRVTSYDVLNVFTSLANGENVRYSTQRKLQATGGLFVHRGDDLLHRCTQCERPLFA